MSATDFITENKSIFAISISTIALIALISTMPPVFAGSDPFVGEIMFFGGNFAPRGWAFCDGQLLTVSPQNDVLFSLLGTNYGGDGRTTFGVPDMRGRFPVHQGTGPGLSTHQLGQKAGAETVTLTTNQIPDHSHSLGPLANPQLKAANALGDSTSASGNALGLSLARLYSTQTPNSAMHADSISATISGDGIVANAGGNQPHENRPPFLAINCNISLTGIIPSRS